jgi:isopentenyldiphosphate isomerase
MFSAFRHEPEAMRRLCRFTYVAATKDGGNTDISGQTGIFQQHLEKLFMQNKDELIVIVDRNNNVTGTEHRSVMRTRGLLHRATYILVFNSKGYLFVQKRTVTKDIYPGYYDVAIGGVVLAGESYEESADREIEEELGIGSISLKCLFDFYFEDAGNQVWGRAYTCVHDGAIVLQEEEIESGDFRRVDEILTSADHEPYTPDGIYVLKRYLSEHMR